MRPFAVAGIQMSLSAVEDNLPPMRQKLDLLMHLYPWVQMVVFSELAACGPDLRRAQRLPGPLEESFRQMARFHEIWLIPGSIFETDGQHVYNTTSVIDPAGEVIGRYRKMFPFLPYEQGVTPGSDFLAFDVPDVGRFGISICYDMWFPETSRTLAAMGVEVLLHPSLTPTIDRDVELAIARATAATNQMFVVDVNGVGDCGIGRSIFVGPEGNVLHEAGRAPELIPMEIDIERVGRNREFGLRGLGQPIKSFRDRKVDFDVYRSGAPGFEYLQTLGRLDKPTRGSRVGLDNQQEPSA